MEKEKLNISYIDTTGINIVDDSIIKGRDYTVDDCVLVRTTDVFPFDGIIRIPKNDNAYSFDKSTIMGNAISKVIRRKYSYDGLTDDQKAFVDKEISEYNVVFETCRSTVHFTMNGLVESTMYGNFEGRPYVILEPLKYHLDSSVKSLRVEDVYFDKDVVLSNESCILISEEFFKTISNNLECLESLKKFKIILYRGNQQAAVKRALEVLGYDSFMINNHGYVKGIDAGTAANNMWNFSHKLADKYNIGLDRHYTSEINNLDRIARQEKAIEIDKLHLNYILYNSNVSQTLIESINEALNDGVYFNDKLDDLMLELINVVGLEQIKKLTKEFNDRYISELNSTKRKVM